MGRCRVVRPETIRLPLSDGDWIDVIRELNAGEYFDCILEMTERKRFAKILAYVIGWSFVDLDGSPLPYSVELPIEERRAIVAAQDTGTIREMIVALDRHEAAANAAIDAKKKIPPSSSTSSPPSGSVAP